MRVLRTAGGSVTGDPDVIVIGAGPNGLFAACRLAEAGFAVEVLERSDRVGGALWSVDSTSDGCLHDVGAAFVAFRDSPAFRALGLQNHGLEWLFGEYESAYPALDGTCPGISRDVELSVASMGAHDGEAWRELQAFHQRNEEAMLRFMGPIGTIAPAFSLGPMAGIRLARMALSSPAGFAARHFRSEAALRMLPGTGMHVDIGPHDRIGAAIGYMLALRSSTTGFAVPRGGAKAVTEALLSKLRAHGGTVRTGAEVDQVVVQQGRARGVVLHGGERLDCKVAVVANTSAPFLYLKLLDRVHVSSGIRSKMERFPMGWGTLKVDYSLRAPVPWTSDVARRSSVVHTGESIEDLDRFTRGIRAGEFPHRPYLVIGQQSLVDDSRAPEGMHTLYVYTRVPVNPAEGWESMGPRYADVIDERIEGLAPGFKEIVANRAIQTPRDLQAMSPNLINGDLGGGTASWTNQGPLRPVFPYFRHRTPVDRLYLASSFTHPGTGIHGMCGWNAASMLLADAG